MREIKFRAWDSEEEEMFSHQELCDEPVTLANLLNSDLPHELMQYTGIKDKCGQEIYEDDALGLWGDGEYMLLGFVGYGSQENIFAGMFALFDKDDHMNDFTLEDYAKPENWGHLKVIGNRYENPELLKAENEI